MGQEQSGDVKDYHGVKNLSGADLVARMELLSAYRVMRVFPGSPASRSGLAAFEDFVVAVNQALVEGDGALSEILAAAEGTEVSLSVWNCVDEAVRNVKLTPAKWNGPGLLGAAVRFESIKGAMDSIWRVLDVLPNSPADNAGLVPRTDYIVGTTAEVFRTEATFSNLISDAAKRGIATHLMVYSTATGRVRNVELRPSSEWGGEGVVGCELATGLLHRIRRDSAS